ncbi:conserved hypothetical protein [Talaromyces stipitatus ATCC 10500]|uniref:Uncharacterized protein n=1 Tax=Talaromyces stipitatus (strain ATCC 10500 / CBS 375.48 / QM 6759 / NRRL 1006) TaxID=441959 RepID=B8M6H7_TALSN|nr:uncharacterized protein TSTA_027360 [Talaromyces stipitatus ATCC 10500]EED19439.1 conserved hypothetical protein [Talaromyces stipitatus ATCC 10500]
MASEIAGEAATIPLTNGRHPPSNESAVPSPPGKRKRASTPEGKPTNEKKSAVKSSEEEKIELNRNLRYILQIAAQDDEHLSVFKTSLTPASPSKPRSKRPKLSDDSNTLDSIDACVDANQYLSYQDFLSDVNKASAAVVERQTALGNEDVSLIQMKVAALKDRLKGLVQQALVQGSTQIKVEPASDESPQDVLRRDRKVLTLYGGSSSNAKQLFSSLQKTDADSISDKPATFPEDRLPNGITTTRAIPFNLEMEEKSVKTFGEVFAPRSTLPPLEPPRRSRPWARDPSSTWIDPFDAITNYDAILGQRHHYSFAKLPAGYWLHYGGDSAYASYWNRREKQESQNEEETTTQLPRSIGEEKGLLFGAYSSFAPSYDSSYAVVASDAKNSMWWAKRGSRRFNTMVAFHNAAQTAEDQTLSGLDETTLEEDVKSFIEKGTLEAKPEETSETPLKDKDVDAVLQDIAELLQTLDSFRRNRNLEPSSQGETKTDDKAGTPDSPSEAELLTYETLKSGLAAIISNLPPYAVAKLNGDQLADLNISQKILVEMPNYNGTMEEDDYTLMQRRIAASAPAATPSRTGSYQATPGYNQRLYSANPRPQQSAVGTQGYYQSRPSSSTPYTPGASTPQQNYAGIRPQASPSQRPSSIPAYSPGQYHPRPTSNSYLPYTGQSTTSPGPGYQQNPAYAAGRSASPHKAHSYATPQSAARTAYLNPASGNAQRYYSQHTYTNYPSSATATPGQYAMSPNVAAAYSRNTAAEQAMALARQKAQLDAARQVSGTPNPAQSIAQASSQERSESPAMKHSATPTPATS